MRRARRGCAALLSALVAVAVLPATAAAHPDPRTPADQELFAGEGVDGGGKQGPGGPGSLPPQRTGALELVGSAPITNPAGEGVEGRTADVTGHGSFAYLNAFFQPTCEAGGVHVLDLADPTAPVEVTEAFIPTSPGSYAGEGIQVIEMDNAFFTGDLLVHQNETCDEELITDPALVGGISLWDVTDPRAPRPLARHAGDTTDELGGIKPGANTVHSMRLWTSEFDDRTYAVLVDNEEDTDVDILDVTDPRAPVMINDTLDLDALFGVAQDSPATLTDVFAHDMDVYRVGDRYVMTMNYWDGGYVLLDVTDPRAVTLIAETDYAELDEQRLARGHEIAPEGNAHQSELSPDHRFLVGTDEDFAPLQTTLTIASGDAAGRSFPTTPAADAGSLDEGAPLAGPTTHLGLGCDPAEVPAGEGVAVLERGVCEFGVKLANVAAAGYSAGVVYNAAVDGCEERVGMAAEGDIPFLFVSRSAGLLLLGVDTEPETVCTTTAPEPRVPGADVVLESVFDGWGYVRLFGTDIPDAPGTPGSLTQIDTYAVPESQDPAFATGFGDLSVHEVAMDPDTQGVAYLSYYAAGIRVVEYGPDGLTEVASYVDERGSNFWGVEVWYDDKGTKYLLASDRDLGLFVFRYPPADAG